MTDHPIVLFDGVCNVCNRLTQFLIRHDASPGRFRFAALQSESGQRLLREHGLSTDELDTFVLVEGATVTVRSTAALRVCRHLGFPWSLLAVLLGVPVPLRDFVYRWFARNRYRWFGRRETCMVPTEDVRARFLS